MMLFKGWELTFILLGVAFCGGLVVYSYKNGGRVERIECPVTDQERKKSGNSLPKPYIVKETPGEPLDRPYHLRKALAGVRKCPYRNHKSTKYVAKCPYVRREPHSLVEKPPYVKKDRINKS